MAERKLQERVHRDLFRGVIPASLEELLCELRLRIIYADSKCCLFESPHPDRYLKYVVHPHTFEPLNKWLQDVVLRGLRLQQKVADLPGVQRVYGDGFYNGIPGLFELEFVHGTPLLEYTEADSTKRIEQERLLLIGVSLYGQLESVHERDVMHRDVKPGNIVLQAGIDSVLIDWSVAVNREEHEKEMRDGRSIGTPPYIRLDNDVFPVRDEYGLGFTLIEASASTEDRYGLVEVLASARHQIDLYNRTNEWIRKTLEKNRGQIPAELYDMMETLLHPSEERIAYAHAQGALLALAKTMVVGPDEKITTAARPAARRQATYGADSSALN